MWHSLTDFEKHVFETLGELLTLSKLNDQRMAIMSLDFTKINAAFAQNTTDTQALIALCTKLLANQPSTTDQATLDALAGSVVVNNTTIETELATAAGPSGTTGASGTTGTTGVSGATGP